MKEAFDSIKNTVNERLGNPFYGTLIITWLLWNWKIAYFILFIKAQKDPCSICFIQSQLANYSHSIVFPILSTLIIILLVPKLTNYLFEQTEKFENEKYHIKLKYHKTKPLTLEASLELQNELEELKEKHAKSTSENKKVVDKLEKSLEEVKTKHVDILKKYSEPYVSMALYGVNEKVVDVTLQLNSIISSQVKNFEANHTTFKIPDPAEGQLKYLYITYYVDGYTFRNETYVEGSKVFVNKDKTSS